MYMYMYNVYWYIIYDLYVHVQYKPGTTVYAESNMYMYTCMCSMYMYTEHICVYCFHCSSCNTCSVCTLCIIILFFWLDAVHGLSVAILLLNTDLHTDVSFL